MSAPVQEAIRFAEGVAERISTLERGRDDSGTLAFYQDSWPPFAG